MFNRTPPPTARWMRQRAAIRVLDLERTVFGRTVGHVDHLIDWLETPGNMGVVVDSGDDVRGYLLARVVQKDNLIKILNLGVHPGHRRRSLALLMFAFAFHHNPTATLNAMIPERAVECQLFLKAKGFKMVGVHKNYFPESGQDAYRFIKEQPASVEKLPF